MTNTHSLPLLQFPFLAIENIIQQMKIKEQLDLFTLSKRAQWAVKAGTSRQNFYMMLECSGSVEITITNTTLGQDHKIRLTPYPRISELKKFVVRISDAFKNLNCSLCIFDGGRFRSILKLVPFLNQRNILQELFVASEIDKLCELGLKAGKDTKSLSCFCRPSPNFNPQGLGLFELEDLIINNSSWVTLDHLSNHFMDCRRISLMESKWSTQDLNGFFKRWIEGSKMTLFSWMGSFDQWHVQGSGASILPEALDGIPSVAVEKVKINNHIRKFKDDECFMIEQVGGAKAIVYRDFGPVIMRTDISFDFKEEDEVNEKKKPMWNMPDE